MKIAIIGYSGAGKSTLAKKLAEKYSCPLLYLDKVNFKNSWQERDEEEAKNVVSEFMKNESWVIDGNYRGFYQAERLKEADKIVFLDFPRRTCLYRAIKRYFENFNKVRESASDGCIEKLDFEFIKWILVDGRSKEYRNNYENILRTYKNKTYILKNKKEVNNYLSQIK